ncbi:MAG: DUF2271 domain-containing protein [Paludibacter sp.]|nr:DUF2271 domain-containing protein [Paludibacter sp.]
MKKILFTLLIVFLANYLQAQTSAPEATTATAGTLTVTYTIVSSTYINAVWIKSVTPASFVRTLTVFGQENKYNNELVKWTADSGTRNYTNAVTGATKASTAVMTSTWNGKDISNTTIVPDGDYTIKIEMTTETSGTNSKLVTGNFTKGPVAQTITPANVSPISNIKIAWAPASTTSINNLEMDKLYSVYPNPAVSSIYVSGLNIEGVDICSLSGKILIMSKESNVNISKLPKGVYLAVIYAKTGTVVKKIEKL